jgi:predicted O-methyltransferase YrrM
MLKINSSDGVLDLLGTMGNIPPFRKRKTKMMFDLAGYVDKKYTIVELGTFHGWGAIALAFGAMCGNKAHVYTIDEYTARIGWTGDIYSDEDYARFTDNVKRAGLTSKITLIQKSIDEAFDDVEPKIGMLVWDLGDDGKRGNFPLYKDFLKWKEKVIEGGMMMLIDTFDRGFGSSLVKDYVYENPEEAEIMWDEKGILVICHTNIALPFG